MKQRLDTLVVAQGLARNRDRAKRLILAGQVYANEERLEKPGSLHPDTMVLQLRERGTRYVSRGGHKLAHALDCFGLDVKDEVALDIGSSTGGFTDCLLQRGVDHVYAVDAGYAQLADKLRRDHRVTVMERTNARYLKRAMFQHSIGLISVDVSFISLEPVLTAIREIVELGTPAVVLLKPQFEASKEQVSRGGVVLDPLVHRLLLTECPKKWFGWQTVDLTFSPITGPAGNIEFLLYLVNKGTAEQPSDWEDRVHSTVESAHRKLGQSPSNPNR